MDGTAILIAVAIGVLLGATSSLVTRTLGVWVGVGVGVAFVIGGLSLLAVVDLGAVVTAMLAFAVTAAIFDPRSGAAKSHRTA